MIQVNDIHKSFGDVKVLKGISATFNPGETSLIIGQSGAGKTVFLKCLLGLHTPEEGSISYNGKANVDMDIEDQRKFRQELGMVFQGSALFDSLSVEENVMFPLEMFTNQTDEEMLERVNFVLKRVNLENANKKFPAELSGGMQKRVAIARAIAMKPKYLFCDEPNSGLDPGTSVLIDNLIQEITQEYNITTVINTHDMNSVMEIGDKILFLKDGLKEWEGSSNEIFKTDNKAVTNFVYSSNLFKKVRKAYLNDL